MSAFAGQAVGFEHVGLSVRDLDAMIDWYGRALDLAVEGRFAIPEAELRAALLAAPGGLRLELFAVAGSAPNPALAASPEATLLTHGYGHVAVGVADLDAAYATLLAAGARATKPPGEARTPGRRHAYVADPEGNHFQLMEGPGAGGLDHVALSVADAGAQAEWYRQALGMEIVEDVDNPATSVRVVVLRGPTDYRLELAQLPGAQPDPNAAPSPEDSLRWHGFGHVALRVADVHAAFRALLDGGARAVIEPRPAFIEGALYAYVTDPEGHQIEVTQSPSG